MMTSILSMLAALFFMAPQSEMKTIDAQLADFNAVTCNVPIRLEYSVGEPSIEITAPEEVLLNMTYVVRNGRLTIALAKKKPYKLSGVVVKISSLSLSALDLNGAVTFYAKDTIYANNFTTKINGASNFTATSVKAENIYFTINGASTSSIKGIEAANVELKINGAGKIVAGGYADSVTATLNGAGTIDCEELQSTQLKSQINGAGKIIRSR